VKNRDLSKRFLLTKALIKKQKNTFEGPYLCDKVWIRHGQHC
jgi:hypothetical protein